jgi:16S rRNA (cytidine1402-2'-O)-methyltransferase
MALFSVVGTPIGNLEDITLRALRVLKEADLVLCEDTRVTKRLFERYDIHVPTMSYHAHSKLAKIDLIISKLEEGKNIALVSDAGTPGISDPGALLVSKIREQCTDAIKNGEIKIESVPGPSALIAALSIAGIPCADFTFFGFLPHKKGRETIFKEIASMSRTAVFYESPHRILKTLEALHVHAPEKTVVIARELTKIYEEIVRGNASEVTTYFTDHSDKVRGEFVGIVF